THLCRSFLFFFRCSGAHRDLHSFPTRRSSDLAADFFLLVAALVFFAPLLVCFVLGAFSLVADALRSWFFAPFAFAADLLLRPALAVLFPFARLAMTDSSSKSILRLSRSTRTTRTTSSSPSPKTLRVRSPTRRCWAASKL